MVDARSMASVRRALGMHEAGRGKRYSAALKARVIAIVMELRRDGRSLTEAAAELGLRPHTVQRWCGDGAVGCARMRRVELVAERPSRTLAIVSPTGFRVDGITIEEVAALMRALG